MFNAMALLAVSALLGILSYILINLVIVRFLQKVPVDPGYLLGMAALLLICLWVKSLAYFKGLSASHELAYDTLLGIRKRLADKVMKMPMGAVVRRGSGGLKKSFVENVEDMELILAHAMPEGFGNALAVALVSVALFVLDWRLALLTLAVLPIGMGAIMLMFQGSVKRMGPYYEASREMNENMIEYITGMEVIKVFNQTTSSFHKFSSSVEKYTKYTLDWFHISWNYMTVYSVFLPATLLFLLPGGTLFYLHGTLPLSRFVLCMMLAMSLGSPLARLVEFFPTFPMLRQKAQKLEDVLNEEEIVSRDGGKTPDGYAVSFQNVSFAYGDADVLKDVTLTAGEGSLTALVGESGAGKSTLAKLLVRFWDIREGSIQIGGVDIRDIDFGTLMNLISYVSQDIFLFDTTLMENIRMGRPDATDQEVINIAKTAQCHEFITTLENGYQTMAGDAGGKLSGGQKQRISIARALLKDAPIVVLDEATSFTDPENEDKLQEVISQLVKGKTLIVIAHRLSTIVNADTIVVMDNGKISASGRHEALLSASPVYRRLWQAHQQSMNWDIGAKEGPANV